VREGQRENGPLRYKKSHTSSLRVGSLIQTLPKKERRKVTYSFDLQKGQTFKLSEAFILQPNNRNFLIQ